jgi:hypothetical protein
MESKNNNTIQLLASGDAFIGKNEVVNGYLNIVCNLFTTEDCIITCEQSTNGSNYEFVDTFVHSIADFGTTTRTQFFVKAYWVRIKVENASFNNIPKIVLTTLFTASNQDSSLEQPDTVQGSVNVINSMLANYNDGTTDFLKPVACDVNGVLKSNLVVEGITLTPATDAVSVYGSTDQTVANAKLLNTDVDGKLNVNITSLTLEASDDGVGCFGSSDGTDRIIMKTDAGGTLNTVSTTADTLITSLNALVAENKALLQKLEINANQLPISTQMINVGTGGTPLQFVAGQVIGTVVDMGTMETRNNDICFSGHAIIGAEGSGYDDPQIILQFSINQTDWFADGTAASYYKHAATSWDFNFQRNNVGLRYVRMLCAKPIQLNLLIATKFKN